MQTEKSKEAHRIHDLPGVSYGCGVLYRAGLCYDLSDVGDAESFKRHAANDLYHMKMADLRNLSDFWGAGRQKDKRSLILAIVQTWARAVHPTCRPSSNHTIVVRDCPAKHYR